MKTITTQEALTLIQNCAAIVIDNVVTYPTWEELTGDTDDCWLDIVWEDDFNEFGVTFAEDCGEIEFDGTNLFINDINGDEQMITLLVPMKG